MNYETAKRTLVHARTGARLATKSIAPHTRLRAGTGPLSEMVVSYAVEYYHEEILILYQNGNVSIPTSSRTSMAQRRLNAFLPSGFQVWSQGPFWYMRTPTGRRVLRPLMLVDERGRDVNVARPLQRLDALELKARVEAYAKECVARLTRGELDLPGSGVHCPGCISTGDAAAHFLKHLDQNVFPIELVKSAADTCGRLSRQFFETRSAREVIAACWHDRQILVRRPRSKKALIAQTEARMTSPHAITDDWLLPLHKHRRMLRTVIEGHLLELFGFYRWD